MQSTWSASWKSSEIITTKTAFTNRSVAARQENDLANRRLPMQFLITTLGGTIAADCSRCQSQRNYEFAMDTVFISHATPHDNDFVRWLGTRLASADDAGPLLSCSLTRSVRRMRCRTTTVAQTCYPETVLPPPNGA